MKPGIFAKRVPARLRPSGGRRRHWRHAVQLSAPLLPDSGAYVSLGHRYAVDLGSEHAHQLLLVDRDSSQPPLTFEAAMQACALLSFATDGPVVPVHYGPAPI